MEILNLFWRTDNISEECTYDRAPVIPTSKDGERNECNTLEKIVHPSLLTIGMEK
jgi:hypothetical protein